MKEQSPSFGQMFVTEETPYPLSQEKLQNVINLQMKLLTTSASKAQEVTSTSSGTTKINAEGFLYYYQSLLDKNISPLVVNKVLDVDRESGQPRLRSRYQTDVFSDQVFGCWSYENPFTWIPSLDSRRPQLLADVPILSFNNFLIAFQPPSSRTEVMNDINQIPSLLHHRDYLLREVVKGSFILGDEKFAVDRFVLVCHDLIRRFKSVLKQPVSKEVMEKIRFELQEGNHLTYIDFGGREIDTGQTPFEVWREFKLQNPEMIKRLSALAQHKEGLGENQFLQGLAELYRAIIDLRMQGFSFYPDLTV